MKHTVRMCLRSETEGTGIMWDFEAILDGVVVESVHEEQANGIVKLTCSVKVARLSPNRSR